MSSNQLLFYLVAWSMMPISNEVQAHDHAPLSNQVDRVTRGWEDIDVYAEEAVVSKFAGFFDTKIEVSSPDVINPETELGALALTIADFSGKPVNHPTELTGLFTSGSDRIPSKVMLSLQQRADARNAFDVKLTGVSSSTLVGVATVDTGSITMRLQDGKPYTTVIVLRRHQQTPKHIDTVPRVAPDRQNLEK